MRFDAALSVWVLQHCATPGEDIARINKARSSRAAICFVANGNLRSFRRPSRAGQRRARHQGDGDRRVRTGARGPVRAREDDRHHRRGLFLGTYRGPAVKKRAARRLPSCVGELARRDLIQVDPRQGYGRGQYARTLPSSKNPSGRARAIFRMAATEEQTALHDVMRDLTV